jgi:hypothetical protein
MNRNPIKSNKTLKTLSSRIALSLVLLLSVQSASALLCGPCFVVGVLALGGAQTIDQLNGSTPEGAAWNQVMYQHQQLKKLHYWSTKYSRDNPGKLDRESWEQSARLYHKTIDSFARDLVVPHMGKEVFTASYGSPVREDGGRNHEYYRKVAHLAIESYKLARPGLIGKSHSAAEQFSSK